MTAIGAIGDVEALQLVTGLDEVDGYVKWSLAFQYLLLLERAAIDTKSEFNIRGHSESRFSLSSVALQQLSAELIQE